MYPIDLLPNLAPAQVCMRQEIDESLNRLLEVDVVFPERVITVDQEELTARGGRHAPKATAPSGRRLSWSGHLYLVPVGAAIRGPKQGVGVVWTRDCHSPTMIGIGKGHLENRGSVLRLEDLPALSAVCGAADRRTGLGDRFARRTLVDRGEPPVVGIQVEVLPLVAGRLHAI